MSSTARGCNGARSGGFTLVELVVTASVVAMVVAGAATFMAQTTAARTTAERDAEVYAEADAAVHAMATALSNALRPRGDEEILFEGMSSARDGMPADRVRFRMVSAYPVRPGEPESDVREVDFGLSDGEGGGLAVLERRMDPTLNEPSDEGGVVDRIAEHVTGLEIRYFDGEQWQDEWPEEWNELPMAVRVTLGVASDPAARDAGMRRAESVTMSRLVYLARMPERERPGHVQPQQQGEPRS